MSNWSSRMIATDDGCDVRRRVIRYYPLPASRWPALHKPMGTGTMSAVASTTEPAPWQPAAQTLLAVRSVSVRFGGIVALDDVSFDLAPHQLLGLIGPNGAGKTTLFNCVSRLYTPAGGDILFGGRSILKTPPHRMVDLGISRTFQNLALFGRMSVLDNVRVGAHRRSRGDFFSDALGLPAAIRRDTSLTDAAWELGEISASTALPHTWFPTCRSDCRSGSSCSRARRGA